MTWQTNVNGMMECGPYVIEKVDEKHWAVAYYGDPVESLDNEETLQAAKKACEKHQKHLKLAKIILAFLPFLGLLGVFVLTSGVREWVK